MLHGLSRPSFSQCGTSNTLDRAVSEGDFLDHKAYCMETPAWEGGEDGMQRHCCRAVSDGQEAKGHQEDAWGP